MIEAENSAELARMHTEKHQAEKEHHEQAREAHVGLHVSDRRAVETALEAEQRRLEEHRTAHAAAHEAHSALHDSSNAAHVDQHRAEQRAIEAATTAMDKRLDAMNEFRDQLRDQAASFVRRDQLESLDASVDRRYEELRSLIATEREERRSNEGARRGINQSTAFIVGAIGLTGTIVGILVVVVNLL